MKLTVYKLGIVFLLIPLLSFSNNIKGKYKKTKKVSKTFEANRNTVLNIQNKYGNIDITTWNENRIVIDVTITVSGNDEEQVEDKLEKIRIKFDENGNQVSATTHTGKTKSKSWFSSSWFSWSTSSNLNYQIDYTVKMPIENNLNVFNDYGSIVLNELNGEANINCDYGKIIIGDLNNTHNVINIDYTNHSSIDFINKGTINADFSKFSLEKANEITLNADYTTSHFEEIKNLDFNCDFGKMTLGKVHTMSGYTDYTTVNIEEVTQNIDLNTSFGSLKIQSLNEGFIKADITASYTSIKIGIDPKASCQIKSDLSFGKLSYEGDLFNFNRKKIKSTSKSYSGYFNSENSDAILKTNSEFGSVKLFQN